MWSFLRLLLPAVLLALVATTANATSKHNRKVSQRLFDSLEELSRIIDISYCVGTTGVHEPFECLSRCKDFEGFELITSWNTGPLLSDSCGYIAVSHPPHPKRVIVAFRGTYSIANTVADLSTVPAEYAPYPGNNNESVCVEIAQQKNQGNGFKQQSKRGAPHDPKCENCTVHLGFMTSWKNTRCTIVPHVENALIEHPDYELTLVGHSLGGAVATLAALEFQARGWDVHITTFGEPRLGNKALNRYINERFNLTTVDPEHSRFRRVTHIDDPVPLLPLEEWGYSMHAGEIFISKPGLPPTVDDLQHCEGDEDPLCISDHEPPSLTREQMLELKKASIDEDVHSQGWLSVPPRYKLWQLFFAHRDYFWRLGLCVPGGVPWDWFHDKYGAARAREDL